MDIHVLSTCVGSLYVCMYVCASGMGVLVLGLCPLCWHELQHNEGTLAVRMIQKIVGTIPIYHTSTSVTLTMIMIRWIWLVPILMIIVVSIVLIPKKVKDHVPIMYLYIGAIVSPQAV